MPIYEYECTQCKERSEIIHGVSDPPHTHCPKCGGEVRKLFSAPAIQFKGSGWYKTDYASPSSKPSEAKSESAKSESAKSESAKSEPSGSAPASEKKSETKAD